MKKLIKYAEQKIKKHDFWGCLEGEEKAKIIADVNLKTNILNMKNDNKPFSDIREFISNETFKSIHDGTAFRKRRNFLENNYRNEKEISSESEDRSFESREERNYASEEEMSCKSEKSSRNYDKKTKMMAKGKLPSPTYKKKKNY